MLTLLGILTASFILSCVLTPLARTWAGRWGLVDRPDARRKMHARPIPVAGGIAVFVSACLVLGATLFFANPLQDELASRPSQLLGLFLAALLLCVLGVLDDFHCVRGRHKLLGQIAA